MTKQKTIPELVEEMFFGHGPETAEVSIKRKDGKIIALIEERFKQAMLLLADEVLELKESGQ